MNVKAKETAEQQLLKIMEAASGGGVSSEQKKIKKEQNLLSIVRTVNKFLYVGVVTMAILFVYEILSGMSLMGARLDFTAPMSVPYKSANIVIAQKLSYYIAKVDQRNIFKPANESTKKSLVTNLGDDRQIARETAGLRLVGISWLDTVDSASVMLEDVEKSITYVLQRGEKITETNISITTIYADSVKVGNDDEEIIIHYDQSQM